MDLRFAAILYVETRNEVDIINIIENWILVVGYNRCIRDFFCCRTERKPV